MSFKLLLRTIVFLAILFVMLYLGMNNTQSITFFFPIAYAKGVNEPAGLIYFGVFAIGVIAGTMLHFGSGKKSGSSKGDSKK